MDDEDEMHVEDETVGSFLINNMKDSIRFKMFPRNNELGGHTPIDLKVNLQEEE